MLFCYICHILRSMKILQMQPVYLVLMINLSPALMPTWNGDKWVLICVYLSGGLQKAPLFVLHWHRIKSPAPLRIRIHLITYKQQNMNTMNAKTDFPDHWPLQKAVVPCAEPKRINCKECLTNVLIWKHFHAIYLYSLSDIPYIHSLGNDSSSVVLIFLLTWPFHSTTPLTFSHSMRR